MTGLVIRLAAPLQSWGEHSSFTDRDTQMFPTRSGVIGIFAAAQGLRRGESLKRYDDLRLTVRVDRPGAIITDFHTVGGGRPRHQTVPTAEGKRRSAGMTTIVTRRNYLSDAVFTLAVESSNDALLRSIASALRQPRWQPYLGRRSCPPDQPFLLRDDVDDPVTELLTNVPVPRWPKEENILDFFFEDLGDDIRVVTELRDVPEAFNKPDRIFRTRRVVRSPRHVPEELWFGSPRAYREALFSYVAQGT